MKASDVIKFLNCSPDADVIIFDEEGQPKEIRLVIDIDGEILTFGVMAVD